MIASFAYPLVAGFAILAIALAAVAAERHLVLIILAIELIFLSSTVLLVYFFAERGVESAEAVLLLSAIWAVAAVEAMALITFYAYMKASGQRFDVSLLSRIKG